jgi:hypothetical protein
MKDHGGGGEGGGGLDSICSMMIFSHINRSC